MELTEGYIALGKTSKKQRRIASQKKAEQAASAASKMESGAQLTAAEILALPRDKRPPRSEWPIDMTENPNPYPQREEDSYLADPWRSSGSGIGFFNVIGFLILWAICAGVIYAANNALGYPYPWVIGIVGGLFAACIILAIGKGGSSGGFNVDNWW